MFVDGIDVFALPRRELVRLRASTIGFVFQSHNLLESLTIEENVALAMRGRNEKHRATEILVSMGLERCLGRRPRSLSLGEQQRVAIARALYIEPKVLIADEPTASLDGENVDTVMNAFRFAAERGALVMISSYDERCIRRADRRIELSDGRVRSVQLR